MLKEKNITLLMVAFESVVLHSVPVGVVVLTYWTIFSASPLDCIQNSLHSQDFDKAPHSAPGSSSYLIRAYIQQLGLQLVTPASRVLISLHSH